MLATTFCRQRHNTVGSLKLPSLIFIFISWVNKDHEDLLVARPLYGPTNGGFLRPPLISEDEAKAAIEMRMTNRHLRRCSTLAFVMYILTDNWTTSCSSQCRCCLIAVVPLSLIFILYIMISLISDVFTHTDEFPSTSTKHNKCPRCCWVLDCHPVSPRQTKKLVGIVFDVALGMSFIYIHKNGTKGTIQK